MRKLFLEIMSGALINLQVWQLITMRTLFPAWNKHLLKTHIIGIIVHEDLRKTSRSPCRRSFSEAPAQHKQQFTALRICHTKT